jgi:hypothetical protein
VQLATVAASFASAVSFVAAITPVGCRVMTTRRGFLALGAGGGAAAVLAACGEDVPEPSADRDAELLSDALVGEENTNAALGEAVRLAEGADQATLRELSKQASANATRIQDALADLDTTPKGEFSVPSGGNLDAVLQAAVEQTNAAVEAYRLGAGQLTTEDLRATAIALAVADGARLSLLRGILGEDEAPNAFVTGTPNPYDPSVTTTTTTTAGGG